MQYKYAVHILMSTHMTEAIGPSHHHMQHICTFKQNEEVADTKKEERYIYICMSQDCGLAWYGSGP
jgi:hypothetical protein